MEVTKRTVALLFVALLAIVAVAVSPLIAAYVSAFLALAIVIGLMGYAAFVALRNWRLEVPSRHREEPKSTGSTEHRAA